MGSSPVTSGITPVESDLVKTCLIIPGQADASFQLLEPKDRVPLIKNNDGTFGPIPALRSEAEFNAQPPVEDIKFMSFALISSDNGLFDLVTNDSPRQYVAKKRDGSVVLTDGPTNNAQMATSIFDVTCEGRIAVRVGSQYYTWTVSGKKTVMRRASGTPDTMFALPDSPAAQKRRRRNKSQEGVAPRCPSYPRELEARVFPGARGNNPNQCGSSSFNVPDLSFGKCCDQHDNDYDDCGMTFEEGNNRFHSCMRGSGCDYLNHWYYWPAYVGCLKTADFYYSVVSSIAGQIAFSQNCGACGVVSPSGYCVGGQPYTPPAFCSRGNGFRNGNFANSGNDWNAQIVSGGGNSNFGVGFDGGAEDADAMVGIFSLYSPNPSASLKTSVKMCPGIAYTLGFQIRRPYGNDNCQYSVYVARDLYNSGNVPLPADRGAGWMWVSGLRVGPFSGERQGVTTAGPELWAEFQLDVRCSGGAPYDFIRVDQFSINPA
ncbi:hypothetical protein PSPO01_04742 [Paraphaeosphaeria sporulosa]